MPINKTLITFFLFFVTLLSSGLCSAQKKNKKNSRTSPAVPRPVIPYNHPTLNAPPGMVYIRGGSTSIRYDQSSTDTNSTRKVSLTSFFIDKTEVTNEQYRQFINWVIDSIAVVNYLKDDKYFIEQKEGESNGSSSSSAGSTTAVLDTAAKPTDTSKIAVASTPVPPADTLGTVHKRIDWTKVSHDRIWDTKNEETRGKLAPLLDENNNIKKDAYNFTYTFLKMVNSKKDTKTATYKTVPVNVYPDENVWATDLTNSQVDMYVENYFKAPPFNDYPVVGVNWVQANAYCYWRTICATGYYNMPSYMKYYHLTYQLPSEAQWVYAAQGFYDLIGAPDSVLDTVGTGTLVTSDSTMTPHPDSMLTGINAPAVATAPAKPKVDSAKEAAKAERIAERKAAKRGNYYIADYLKVNLVKYGGKYSNKYKAGYNPETDGPPVDSTPIHKDPNGMLENFKQEEGDYWEDGAALTTPVLSFAPNEFGLYNMEGNVSEWTMDAYSPSVFAFVSDLNPVLLYDADSTDADAMKRKVVRGGSFMSNAKSLTPFYRDLELQNVAHCFIGFRCVMQAPEIIYKNVETRKHTVRGKRVKGKLEGLRLPEIH
jgi:formylglycine-generating enzyme required for sulfatase activity